MSDEVDTYVSPELARRLAAMGPEPVPTTDLGTIGGDRSKDWVRTNQQPMWDRIVAGAEEYLNPPRPAPDPWPKQPPRDDTDLFAARMMDDATMGPMDPMIAGDINLAAIGLPPQTHDPREQAPYQWSDPPQDDTDLFASRMTDDATMGQLDPGISGDIELAAMGLPMQGQEAPTTAVASPPPAEERDVAMRELLRQQFQNR